PEDRAHFEATTAGHTVILGRRTFDETGEPLPGRRTVVVSTTMPPVAGVTVVPTLDEALAQAYATDPGPFVLGGVRLFEQALPRVTTIHLTEIPESPAADAFFVFDRTPFAETDERRTASGLRFVTLRRRAG
ncbi:MAG: dihydrofolate reductase, partial [Myxococcales bacterium]